MLLLSLFSILSCSINQTRTRLEKAMITPEHIKEAIMLQKEADRKHDVIPEKGDVWFRVMPGKSSVIISAPSRYATVQRG